MNRFLSFLVACWLILMLAAGALAQSNGTLSGSPTFAAASSYSSTLSAANFGQAISLNGSVQSIGLPAGVGKYLASASWFVSCRIITTQSTGLHIVTGSKEGTSGYRSWWIGVNAGVVNASIGSSTTNIVPSSGGVVNDGTWHEIALAVSANVGYLFADGVLVGTQTVTTPTAGNGTLAQIGALGGANVFGGDVDEVSYWNTALHTANYTIPTAPYSNTTSGLNQLYHLDGDANDSYSNPSAPTPTISPLSAIVLTTATRAFTATVANDIGSAGVAWSLLEGSIAGTLSSATTTGVTYTPPTTPGTFHLIATANATGGVTASATLTVNLPVTNLVLSAGNSLTAGNDSSNAATTSYPPVLGTLLGSGWTVINAGVSGQTTQQMTAATGGQIDSYFNAITYPGAQVAVVWEITNDIYVNNLSGAAAYANYVTYCQARKAKGWKIVAVTVLPRANSGIPVDFETRRQAANALIRANWRTFADGLADIAADSRIGVYGDQTNSTYYYISGTADSQVHLVDAGYAIVAQHVHTAIQQAINGTTASTVPARRFIH